MFRLRRWRKRRDQPEEIADKVLLCEDEVEFNFDPPTYDDLKAFFDEIDYEVQMQEERAENRVDNTKMHKVNFVQKVDWFKEGGKK